MTKNLSYIKYDSSWGAKPFNESMVPGKPLYIILEKTAKEHPNKKGFIFMDYGFTYKEIDALSNKLANALIELGVKKGDRVATFLPNSIQHTIVFFGIIKAGAITVPANVMFKPQELAYELKDASAKVIVTLDMLYPVVSEAVKETNIKNIIITSITDFLPGFKPIDLDGIEAYGLMDLINDVDEKAPKIDIDPKEDLVLILYTAGTTGTPKGVMLTHYNFLYNTVNTTNAFEISEKDVNLLLFPMFHVSGYMLLQLPMIYNGGVTILVPRFNAEEYLQIIDKYRVTAFLAPPTVYVAFINHPKFKDYDLSSLRFVFAAGAPVPVYLQEKWKEYTGLDLINGYGLTETSATATASLPNKYNYKTIGVPIGCEVKIADESENIVPREIIGEILIKGGQVMKGYWNKPEETKKTLTENNWLKTGDAGYIDTEGFIHFVERIKDLIVASGYKIPPAEVENILLQHSAVKEVAVFGIPHKYRGETVVAYIVLKSEYKGKISPDAIINWSKEKMAAYKYPRIVRFVDDLPKSPAQKILRRLLRIQELEKMKKEDLH